MIRVLYVYGYYTSLQEKRRNAKKKEERKEKRKKVRKVKKSKEKRRKARKEEEKRAKLKPCMYPVTIPFQTTLFYLQLYPNLASVRLTPPQQYVMVESLMFQTLCFSIANP